MNNISPQLIVSIVVLFAGTLAACTKRSEPAAHAEGHTGHEDHEDHTDEITLSQDAIKANGITIAHAAKEELRQIFVAPGRLAFNADSLVLVSPVVRGRVTKLNFQVGDRVKAGEPLAVLESPELGEAQSDFFQRRAALESAAPAIELARVSWERAKTLYERSGDISLNEVQHRESEYRSLVGTSKSAEAALRAAEQRLQLLGQSASEIAALSAGNTARPRSTLASSVAGVVVARAAIVGETISPEGEAIYVIASEQPPWIIADVSEADIDSIAPGSAALVRVGFRDSPEIAGSISVIDPQVNPATRTSHVRISVPPDSPAIATSRPGTFATVELQRRTGVTELRVIVPSGSIQLIEGKPSVFVPVEGEPGTFAVRPVTTGVSSGNKTQILSGLAEGEPFVASGSFILKAELAKGSAEHAH